MARLAFDTGGTFTNCALIDDTGVLHLHKVLSTRTNPADAVVQGVGELLVRPSVSASKEGLQILGATTVVTNAVLERKGVRTAFLTTDGFQDMLRIRTGGRYDLYDLRIEYPDPLVPRDHCFGVVERMAADGRTIVPLDEASVASIAQHLRDSGVRSIAVCLLHAYKYPGHEKQIGKLLAAADPGLSVSLSSDVCPEVREYDRASTTVVNAYTRPLMAQHVERLEADLRRSNIDCQMLWMTSSGGGGARPMSARAPGALLAFRPSAASPVRPRYAQSA